MADVSLKEQKLAAARKKLRQFRKKKGDAHYKLSNSGDPSNLEVPNNISEYSSSCSSSVADICENETNRQDCLNPDLVPTTTPDPLTGNGLTESQCVSNHNGKQSDNKVILEAAITEEVPCESPNNNNVCASTLSQSGETESPLNYIESSSAYRAETEPIFNYNSYNPPNTIMEVNDNNILNKNDILDNEGSVCSETNASVTTVLHVKNTESSKQGEAVPLKSTVESLRQLSLQMSGLISHSEVQDANEHEETIKELERRNAELASLLDQEKHKNLEHDSLMEEMKRTISSQSVQIESLQKMVTADNSTVEVNGLREQLQMHIQTIGILVAEKSELQTALSHTRYSLDQKGGEVSELQGRLDASRERVRHLEAAAEELQTRLASLTQSKESESEQLANLRSTNAKLSKLCDEMRASMSELTERLSVRSEENQKLSLELTDVRRQLELAQVHVEQLRSLSTDDLKRQFEELQTTYKASQAEVQRLHTALEEAQKEKTQLEYDYKTYAGQLLADLEDVKGKLLSESTKCQELERREAALRTDLKSLESDRNLQASVAELEGERTRLQKLLDNTLKDKKGIEEQYSALSRDNGQLSQLLAEQSAKLEALEAATDRHSTQEVDTTRLLQTMQSDKIAAARALSQNKQLKEQLEELQNGLIMMSNKKLELTEKLERELHIKKNLCKEITQLGEELASHKESLLGKQREIDWLRSTSKISPQQETVTSVDDVSRPSKLSHSHLSSDCHDQTHTGHSHDFQSHEPLPVPQSLDSGAKEEIIEAAEEAVESFTELDDGQKSDETLKHSQTEGDSNLATFSSKEAHEALVKRFLQCMKDLAAMSDEKQKLEHLVQQLQLETETIGDYITIYQFQRGVMKKQMQELETELDMLKTEKQEIMGKLSKLQKLVENLALDKDGLKEGFIHGISSIIRSSSTTNTSSQEEGSDDVEALATKEPDPAGQNALNGEAEPGSQETPSHSQSKAENTSKSDTVLQIMNLISEMETSSQLDLTTLHKFQPCSHCSGRLINV